jgi:hypothetical protein
MTDVRTSPLIITGAVGVAAVIWRLVNRARRLVRTAINHFRQRLIFPPLADLFWLHHPYSKYVHIS